MKSADLLLHPIRLRILQAFLGDRTLTTSQLQDELSDTPPATLYRHISMLVEAGILSVVNEQRIRGAVKRTYILRTSAASVDLNEVSKMSVEEHRRMFLAFIAGLIADFDRYLEKDKVDLLRDGASYRLSGVWLTDKELKEMSNELITVLQPRMANPPKAGRKRWLFGSIVLPGDKMSQKEV